MGGERTPIPPFAEDALVVLVGAAGDSAGLDEETAVQVLEADGFTIADAEEALEVLEMRGYLYRVEEELRITD